MPKVTKRGVVDIGRMCHLNCLHCFHRFSDYHCYGHVQESKKLLKDVIREIDALVAQKREFVSFTGGEPLIYPKFSEILSYALDRGLRPEIITAGHFKNAQKVVKRFGKKKIDWLISLHGSPIMHNYICNDKTAWDQFVGTLFIIDGSYFRINTVFLSFNYLSLHELYYMHFPLLFNNRDYPNPITPKAKLKKPAQINFIKWRPFYGWIGRADRKDRPHDELIKQYMYRRDKGIAEYTDIIFDIISEAMRFCNGINFRYFPKCEIDYAILEDKYNLKGKIKYWSTLNYMFDPWEWCNREITPDEAIEIMQKKWTDRLYYKYGGVCKLCVESDNCEGWLQDYE